MKQYQGKSEKCLRKSCNTHPQALITFGDCIQNSHRKSHGELSLTPSYPEKQCATERAFSNVTFFPSSSSCLLSGLSVYEMRQFSCTFMHRNKISYNWISWLGLVKQKRERNKRILQLSELIYGFRVEVEKKICDQTEKFFAWDNFCLMARKKMSEKIKQFFCCFHDVPGEMNVMCFFFRNFSSPPSAN